MGFYSLFFRRFGIWLNGKAGVRRINIMGKHNITGKY
ncbi:hypothetical protein CJA_0252 [Cellvibrio japonicus Ueda107]|uniref:Uncharacterized protein n=1 Tax=Cellvibrio japonicus (strain Ueda107) TaxID=498211 RepID=B3PH55_CELJU|nr:hypothetical protein CJA_0252 [Cellvibrio japonicus Ueda107]